MKKLIVLLLSIPLLLMGCSDRQSSEIAKEENFYFSKNKTNCAFIFYDVEGAPPLTLENRVLNHHFNEENIITTSSPYDFGWKNKETSGFKDFNYYNGNGSLIEYESEPNYYNAAQTIEDIEYDYAIIHFNSQDECFTNDTFENNEITTNLIKRVYNVKEN